VPSKHDPLDCLSDIIDNIDSVESYTTGMSIEAFASDRRTRDAVERCIERICEAAFRLGDAAAELMPNQPWHDIRGMGNRLRHAYDRIDLKTVWNAVRYDLPSLKADAERALGELRSKQP
jgi:uncharacterized protein with HEPN domain